MWTYVATGDALQNLDWALRRGYLLTNGLGGYASSSLLGCNTRRYHGLLVAALKPPLDRWLLVSHLDELLVLPDGQHYLNTTEYRDGFYPDGFARLTEFCLDPLPVWRWRVGSVEVTKRVVLVHDRNCVLVHYAVRGAPEGSQLVLSPFVGMRSFHELSRRRSGLKVEPDADGPGFRLSVRDGLELHLDFTAGRVVVEPLWYDNVYHRLETERGQEDLEDLLRVGHVTVDAAGPSPSGARTGAGAALGQAEVTLTATLGAAGDVAATFAEAHEAEVRRRRHLLTLAQARDQREGALVVAADQFLVERPGGEERLVTVLAGYHWFGDWGRDTMIALPGLCLATGRVELARRVLQLWAGKLSEGMLPNCFMDDSDRPAYNSVDASLWFIQACQAVMRADGDMDFLREVLWPAIVEIIDRYQAGTRFGIRADTDGLLLAGDQGTQLTWMDAKRGEQVFTPRHGKAVEVNALWVSALHLAAEWSAALGVAPPKAAETRAATADAFRSAFWNPQAGCLYDCLTDGRPDARIRPNQLFAVSLPHAPISGAEGRSVVNVCRRKLLTPYGLRTLAPDDPSYHGRYVGGWFERDSAYHQGTAWPWLLGAYIDALMATTESPSQARDEARHIVESALQTLDAGVLGTIGELFDGDAPHEARGCAAQAWSVAEILRVKKAYDL